MVTPKETFHVEASVTIRLLASENDGATMIQVEPGHLDRNEVIALALQILAGEVVEWFIPALPSSGGHSSPAPAPAQP